jgi:hypothetical protein
MRIFGNLEVESLVVHSLRKFLGERLAGNCWKGETGHVITFVMRH